LIRISVTHGVTAAAGGQVGEEGCHIEGGQRRQQVRAPLEVVAGVEGGQWREAAARKRRGARGARRQGLDEHATRRRLAMSYL
jgi:hypothetical protein